MNLDIHSPLPERKDWRIGCIGSGFIMNDCHLVAYSKAGFNPVAIASRTRGLGGPILPSKPWKNVLSAE